MQTLIINFTSSVFNAGKAYDSISIHSEGNIRWKCVPVILSHGYLLCGRHDFKSLNDPIMPLVRAGSYFLIMQLSRMVILGLIWFQPVFWIFALACVGWGLNMGVTTTLQGPSCRNWLPPNTEQELCLSTASGYLGVL